jgi:polyketide biosynthesis enoyl-CoA hydratase PksH
MALSTTEFTAAEAAAMRLADVVGEDAEVTLRRQLLRLRYLPKSGVARYKRYALELDGMLRAARGLAVAGNAEAFSDPGNLRLIRRYASEGIMPWE